VPDVAPPQLLGFGLANYRSFGPEGFLIRNPKRINVFIGKNNCGKSNILRGLQVLSRLSEPKGGRKGFDNVTDGHRKSGNNLTATAFVPSRALTDSKKIAEHDIGNIEALVGKLLEIHWDTFTGELLLCQQLSSLKWFELSRIMQTWTGHQFNNTIREPEKYIAYLGPHLIDAAIQQLKSLLNRLINIPVFRQIQQGAAQPAEGVFNGANTIESLRDMQNPEAGQDQRRDVFDKIQAFVRELLGNQDLRIEIPSRSSSLNLQMHGLHRLPLDSFGTGIHHLVILCAALAMHSGCVITLEEPEVHLHPDLQRKFLRFIAEQTTNTYFITTHSNVFLDSKLDVSVYHVQFDGKVSSVTHLESTRSSREVLTDMGYKASDLLQANCVIWVEGPSDRIYLNRWLGFVAPDLVEGIHYSIAFYGGKVLSHFTASDDPIGDLVQVLRINRHAIFVMDRDGDDEAAQLNANKERIQEELTTDACWVTQGREIENYLPLALIQRTLAEDYPSVAGIAFGPDDRLNKLLVPLDGFPNRYDKVAFARKFCEAMTVTDLDILNLTARLGDVVRLVRTWNHAEVPAASVTTARG